MQIEKNPNKKWVNYNNGEHKNNKKNKTMQRKHHKHKHTKKHKANIFLKNTTQVKLATNHWETTHKQHKSKANQVEQFN